MVESKSAVVPPEGGYGWVVLIAHAFNSILVIQLIPIFGLVFKDVFSELKITGTDAAVIMNTNNAFSLMLGLFTGPILRTFGARKTAGVGILLVFSGMALTSFADSFIKFLIFYGLIMSFGVGLCFPAFSYTFNSYFKARRSVATGVAMTCTGTAAIFMPQLISVLMREFGPNGTCLLFSAMSLNSMIGVCLLHPVEWHQPSVPSSSDDKNGKVKTDDETVIALEIRDESPNPCSNRKSSWASQRSRNGAERQISQLSAWEASSIDLGRSVLALDGCVHEVVRKPVDADPKARPAGVLSRWLHAVANFFDLRLLKDPGFANLVLGIAFAFFAEINFAIFLPFVLADRGYETHEIAMYLSVLAITDTVCRFLTPFLHRLVGLDSRIMYTGAIFGVVVSRLALLFCQTHLEVTLAFAALGITKGFRVVFYAMVIPDSVPIERLPSAQGIQSLINGIAFVTFGPFIGWLRDYYGSYDVVVASCCVFSGLTLVMWTTEFIVRAVTGRKYKAVSTVSTSAQQH